MHSFSRPPESKEVKKPADQLLPEVIQAIESNNLEKLDEFRKKVKNLDSYPGAIDLFNIRENILSFLKFALKQTDLFSTDLYDNLLLKSKTYEINIEIKKIFEDLYDGPALFIGTILERVLCEEYFQKLPILLLRSIDTKIATLDRGCICSFFYGKTKYSDDRAKIKELLENKILNIKTKKTPAAFNLILATLKTLSCSQDILRQELLAFYHLAAISAVFAKGKVSDEVVYYKDYARQIRKPKKYLQKLDKAISNNMRFGSYRPESKLADPIATSIKEEFKGTLSRNTVIALEQLNKLFVEIECNKMTFHPDLKPIILENLKQFYLEQLKTYFQNNEAPISVGMILSHILYLSTNEELLQKHENLMNSGDKSTVPLRSKLS